MRGFTSAFLLASLLSCSVLATAADSIPAYIGEHFFTPQEMITQDGNVAW